MAGPHRSPYRIYLVIDPFRELLHHLPELLKPLSEIDPYLPGVEGFYDHKIDAALLGLQFQRSAAERIGHNPLIELVAECSLPVIAPEELSEAEYEAFFGQHLPGYPVQLRHHASEGKGRLIDRMLASLAERANKTPPPKVRQKPRDGFVLDTGDGLIEIEGLDDTSDDDELIEIEFDIPGRPRNERASSRWELVLDDDDEDDGTIEVSGNGRAATGWEFVL